MLEKQSIEELRYSDILGVRTERSEREERERERERERAREIEREREIKKIERER